MKRIRESSRPFVTGALLAAFLVGTPIAVAATGSALLEGVRNGTAVKETEIIGSIAATSGKGGYVTRQSNVSTGTRAGGAAIYGCRTPVGGTAVNSAPCLRASNLFNGFAFEFAANSGVAGLISVGNPKLPNPGKPFTTNATGVATGLNADKVDGMDASELMGGSGPTGPTGPLGPTGPTGPSSPNDLRFTAAADETLGNCIDPTLITCANVASRTVGAGNWLVQAKFVVDNDDAAASSTADLCGLVRGTTVLDSARHSLAGAGDPGESEAIALTAVLDGAADGDTVSLRCTEQVGEDLALEDVKLTALQVGSVTGP